VPSWGRFSTCDRFPTGLPRASANAAKAGCKPAAGWKPAPQSTGESTFTSRTHGDVRRVSGRLARNPAGGQNTGRYLRNLWRNVQQRKTLERTHPFPRRHGVSGACFVNHKLRNVKLESAPPLFPPFPGDLLVAGDYQIPAWPRGQVARNSRLQVQSRLHLLILTGLKSTLGVQRPFGDGLARKPGSRADGVG
jgi:hypothetical protein